MIEFKWHTLTTISVPLNPGEFLVEYHHDQRPFNYSYHYFKVMYSTGVVSS